MTFSRPLLLALFQKRIDGDDALLELARLRFRQAGLGMEIYGGSIEELDRLLSFTAGPEATVLVHLPRELDLLTASGRDQVRELARTFDRRLYGFVSHDRPEYAGRPSEFRTALSEMNDALLRTAGRPLLFVEYAAGLDFEQFCTMIESVREFELVNACLDIGHLGICHSRKAYGAKHPGEDICALTPTDPRLPEVIDEVQEAVTGAAEAVCGLVRRLAGLGKPLHFHLHDGHPLSTLSPYGVSDHLSFLETFPLPFAYEGKQSLSSMFGPTGLWRIIGQACAVLSPTLLSFTLEIHPGRRREPLADATFLFNHWIDKTNAELMNGWLLTLTDNHRLLTAACDNACEGGFR